MPDRLEKFEDQDLKAAVRRLRGGHTVRPELRDLVVRRLAELRLATDAGRASEPRPSIRPASAPVHPPWLSLRWLSVAAVVLLIIGGEWGRRYYQRVQDANAEYARGRTLLGAMVAIHDIGRGTASGLQPLATPLSNAKALAAEASNQLGRTVPVVDFAARGWTLDAADLCTVGTDRAVRFHFTRGPQSLSVISLPTSAYPTIAGGRYETVVGGHPMAGHAGGGSLTFVVGDTVCAMGDTVALRDALRD